MNAEGPTGPEVSEPDMAQSTCLRCGLSTPVSYGRARSYCGVSCQAEAQRVRRAAAVAAVVAARPAKPCADASCVAVIPSGSHHTQRYCSSECAAQAIRRQGQEFRARNGLSRKGPKRGVESERECATLDCLQRFVGWDSRHKYCGSCAIARNTRNRTARREVAQSVRNANRTCVLCATTISVDTHGKRMYCKDCFNCGDASKDASLRSAYNINLLQYRAMASHGCCICGLMRSNDRQLAVDHDHACCAGKRSCGKCVRGLLCLSCNTTLGINNDDPARLRAAADYLERNSHGY